MLFVLALEKPHQPQPNPRNKEGHILRAGCTMDPKGSPSSNNASQRGCSERAGPPLNPWWRCRSRSTSNTRSLARQGGCQIDASGGFPDPTFLVMATTWPVILHPDRTRAPARDRSWAHDTYAPSAKRSSRRAHSCSHCAPFIARSRPPASRGAWRRAQSRSRGATARARIPAAWGKGRLLSPAREWVTGEG